MREATELNELMEEYCTAILSAQNDEELTMVKQSMTNTLTTMGYDAESFFAMADMILEQSEEGKITLNFDQNSLEVNNGESTAVAVPENQTQNTNKVGIISGLALASIVIALSLKKKVLNKKKNIEQTIKETPLKR